MEAAIQLSPLLVTPNVPYSLHAQLAALYSDLQLRHKAQKIEMIDYKHKANYWEAQFQQIKTREGELIND